MPLALMTDNSRNYEYKSQILAIVCVLKSTLLDSGIANLSIFKEKYLCYIFPSLIFSLTAKFYLLWNYCGQHMVGSSFVNKNYQSLLLN